MINAIIIDDEAHCITALRHDLNMFCPEVAIAGTCQSGKEGIAAIKRLQPNLVFLDIEMPVMNGFEMLKAIGEERDFQVIFTTAYSQFVLKAIRINALDYLMKPIDGTELSEAVDRVRNQMQHKLREDRRIGNLLANVSLAEEQQRIALPDRNGYDFVSPSEICYCKAEGAYTHVFFTDNRKILVSKALGELENMLPSRIFERIHHSIIVNVNEIRQFKKGEGLLVIMANGDHLSVARSKRDQLLLRLGVK